MSTATVTFEDAGDEVMISVDFGPDGGQEFSGAHQMAVMAVSLVTEKINPSTNLGDAQ